MLGVFCVFTIEFTAHQLHAQRAGPTTNHRDDADVLGYNWSVKKVGLCAVIICVAHKNLQQTNTEKLVGKLEKRSCLWSVLFLGKIMNGKNCLRIKHIFSESLFHLVPLFAICSVSGVSVSIKAACHLEGLDVLSTAHTARTLSDDACQTHLLLHINLLLPNDQGLVDFTALTGVSIQSQVYFH